MMDLARQRIVNRIPAWRRALNSFLPFRREAGGPDSSLRRDHAPMRAVRVSLTPFWVLWNENLHPFTDARAMGAIMRRAQNEGRCESTDRIQRSARPECHCRPLMIWKSTHPNVNHEGAL